MLVSTVFYEDSVRLRQHLPWFNGGIEKRRFVVMKRLAGLGHEVHCFTMHRPEMPRMEFTYEGIHYHCVGRAASGQGMYKSTGKRRSIRMPLNFSARIFFAMLPYRFDVVDADSFPFLHLFPIWVYSKIRGSRFAITWHEVWSRSFWLNYLERIGILGYTAEWLCARLPDYHIANASTTKNLLATELGVPREKVLVFPAAVDKQEILEFISRHEPRKKDQFITVSRLVAHKRVWLSIEAIKKTKAKLLIVGVGPDEGDLKVRADQEARGKVKFVDSLSNERLFEEIQDSVALIMPSEREGLSLITLESLAIGTPVVIATTSSLPREIRGMCLEARGDRMGDLLNRMLANRRRYARISDATQKEVLDRFSGEDAGDVYSKIAGRTP